MPVPPSVPAVCVKLAVVALPLNDVVPPEMAMDGSVASGVKERAPPELVRLPVFEKFAVGIRKLMVPPVLRILPTLANVDGAESCQLPLPLVCHVAPEATLTMPVLVPVPPA